MRRSSMFVGVLVSVFAGVAGCSSSDDDGVGGEGTGKTGLDLSFTFTTEAGEETHWCQYTRLPEGIDAASAGRGVSVKGYTWTWQNMHHWALYRTLTDLPANVPLDQPFDCFAPGGMKHAAAGSLILAGMAGGEQKFPEGTGFAFAPGEIVIFQAHTLNTTTAPIAAKLDVVLDTVDPASVPNPLGLIQFYDPYISVPARTESTAHMRCRIPHDMTVLYGTTHQHERGVGVDVFLDVPGAARATTPFLSSTDWEHPNTIEAPMALTKDSYVRTSCRYFGDDHDVFQGQTKEDDEMCMYIAYYYPVVEDAQARGLFENCVQDSFENGVGDEYGVGTASCATSLACIQACPPGDAPNPVDGRIDVGRCWQQCLVDACPSATKPLNDLGICVQDKCAAACADPSTCPACVVGSCGPEYSACQSATCM